MWERSILFNSSDTYKVPTVSEALSGQETEVTKKKSLPLRCVESEVEETDVYALGDHNVPPSPKEVELPVGPPCLSG